MTSKGTRGLAGHRIDAAGQGPGPRQVHDEISSSYLRHHQAGDHERIQCFLVFGLAEFSGNQWRAASPGAKEV
jgi:hypothetical protein